MKLSGKRMISNNIFMIKYALRYTPNYFLQVCFLAIFSSIELFFEFTYCSKYMIELIQYHGKFSKVVFYVILITTAILIKLMWNPILSNRIAPKAKEKLHKELQFELYRKAISLDLSCYDNPEYYNEFVWSVSEASSRMDAIINDLAKLCGSITTILIMGIFFLSQNKIGLVFVIVSLLITLAVNSAIAKLQFQMDAELKPIQRKRNYFNRVFYLSDYAKEIRLNPVATQLKDEFCKENQKIFPIVKKYGRKQTILGFVGDYVANSFLLDVFYLIYLIYQTIVKGLLSYGSMIALFDAASSLKHNLRNISVLLPKFQQHSYYIEKIRHFLSYEANIKNGSKIIQSPEDFKELSLHHVSFGYGKDDSIIQDVSLTIHAGEKIAFVGYNGAGKTTLTKLIMRLYDVQKGEISINGINIKDYKLQDYRNCFGSVFQDYKLYAASVAENVKMDCVLDKDNDMLEHALQKSGFAIRLKKMKKGLHTHLTREFDNDGTNLSGGEAQKLTISRVFAKAFPIIILDEPSSALDPISEYNLNQTMLMASENKTVIFISHRLSSTRMADRIYMLEHGKIIEQGNHQELLELNGKYAEMFRLQAEKYLA